MYVNLTNNSKVLLHYNQKLLACKSFWIWLIGIIYLNSTHLC
jgi:hypothetical protein